MIPRWAKVLLLPFGFLGLYCLAALIGAIIPAGYGRQDAGERNNGERSHQVQLIAGPIHYDFLIPLDRTTRARFQFLEQVGLPVSHNRAEWLVIGWGARSFYTTGTYRDVTAAAVSKGIFGDSSVLRVDILGPLPHLPEVPKISFDDREYMAFLEAIAESFDLAENDRPKSLPHPGFTPTDRFLAAKGQFHLFRTCNTWISNMIQASGRRFGIWTPLPYSVTLSQWRFADP